MVVPFGALATPQSAYFDGLDELDEVDTLDLAGGRKSMGGAFVDAPLYSQSQYFCKLTQIINVGGGSRLAFGPIPPKP
jgi:hypothetical protein